MKNIKKFLLPFLCSALLLTVFTGCNKDPQCFQITSEITDNGNLDQLAVEGVNGILKGCTVSFEEVQKEAKSKFKTYVDEFEKELNAINELNPIKYNFTVTFKLQQCESGKTVATEKVVVG